MNAKDYLNKAYRLDQRINSKLEFKNKTRIAEVLAFNAGVTG